MTAVAFRLRSGVRSRWMSTLGMVLLVAVLGGIVLTLAAGAHRTMTAPDRYTSAFGDVPDVAVTQQDGGPPRTDEIAALPSVASVKAMTFLFAAPADDVDPSDETFSFAGSYAPGGVLLVAGRDADPANPSEFVASRSFVERRNAKLGDTVDMLSLTQEEAQTAGFSDAAVPDGPQFTGTLVGVVNNVVLGESSPTIFFSPALLQAYPEIGVSSTLTSVWLRPGRTLDDFRNEINTLPQSQTFTVDPGVLIGPEIRRAVNAQALALWLLAVVAGVAAISVLGQVITRSVRLAPADRVPLAAIGYTDAQGEAESLARAAIPIAVGTFAAIALAVAPSRIFPTGFIRAVEPDPGIRFDAVVLVLGGAIFIGALTLWVYLSLLVSNRKAPAVLPSAVVESVVTHTSSTTAATGTRFVFTRRRRDRATPRAALAGVAITVAGLVGALVFGVSLNRLVDEPQRYGVNYDAVVGDDGSGSLRPDLLEVLESDPNFVGLVLYSSDYVRIDGHNVPASAFDAVRGNIVPVVAAGRLPVTDDEIAFGRVTADALGVEPGDVVAIEGATGTESFRVTGIALVPGFGANEGVGSGVVLTYPGLQRVDASSQLMAASIKVADRQAAVTELAKFFDGPPPEMTPPEVIVNVTRVRSVPFLLAGVLAALTLLIVANALLAALSGQRRDLAVLRALGADGGWVTRTVHWAATIFMLVPVVLGILVGAVIGRVVFTAFADGMGTIDDPAVPVLLILAVVVGLVVIGNLIAVVPARRARGDSPAAALQME